MRKLAALILAVCFLAGFLLLAATGWQKAAGHAAPGQYAQVNPDIKRWIEGLTDSQGRGCCATADGMPLEEVDWDTEGDNYRVRLKDGKWHKVPDGAVIKGPNRIGYAIVWGYWINEGTDSEQFVFRCFIKGAGT